MEEIRFCLHSPHFLLSGVSDFGVSDVLTQFWSLLVDISFMFLCLTSPIAIFLVTLKVKLVKNIVANLFLKQLLLDF